MYSFIYFIAAKDTMKKVSYKEKMLFEIPALKEAACELYFDYKNDLGWDNSYSGIIMDAVRHLYPKCEPQNEISVGFEIKQGAITPQVLKPRIKFKYSDDANNVLILSENSYAISMAADEKYSWENFKHILFDVSKILTA